MEHEAMAATPTSFTVDEDGDLVLLVGPDDAQARILVSSKVLTVASKVFKTMLSKSAFKEGRELAQRCMYSISRAYSILTIKSQCRQWYAVRIATTRRRPRSHAGPLQYLSLLPPGCSQARRY